MYRLGIDIGSTTIKMALVAFGKEQVKVHLLQVTKHIYRQSAINLLSR